MKQVLVAGYGTMGRGVAKTFAAGGFEVTVLSRRAGSLDDLPEGVSAVAALPEAAPDLILENLPERIELKTAFYRDVEKAYGGRTVIATNTSGLPLEELARELRFPGRFMGLHYLHPAETFPLVEVIRTAGTSDETTDAVMEAVTRTGKEAVLLNRPVVGFLFNRLQHALLHEAYNLVEQGVVSVRDVDRFARMALGPRMCVTGLILQKDLGGLETHALAQQGIVPHLDRDSQPKRVLQDLCAAGETGADAGKGFYDWSKTDVDAYRAAVSERTARVMAVLSDQDPRLSPPKERY